MCCVLSCVVLWCLGWSSLVLCCVLVSRLSFSCLILSCLVSSFLVLCCVVSCLALFCLIFVLSGLGGLGGRWASFLVVLGVVLGSWGGLRALLGGLGSVLVLLLRDGNFPGTSWVDF